MDHAPEVQGIKGLSALPSRASREGFAIFVPGECLKRGSHHWSDAQKEGGVWLKGIYLTASEEEEAVSESQREGKPALVGIYTIRKALVAIAEPLTARDDETGEESTVPGPWRPIPALEIRAYWEEIGSMGRGLFSQAYTLAHTPSAAARAVALASFRQIA